MSQRGKLDKTDGIKLFKSLLLCLVGGFIVWVTGVTETVEFGSWEPFVLALSPLLVNALRRWGTDYSKDAGLKFDPRAGLRKSALIGGESVNSADDFTNKDAYFESKDNEGHVRTAILPIIGLLVLFLLFFGIAIDTWSQQTATIGTFRDSRNITRMYGYGNNPTVKFPQSGQVDVIAAEITLLGSTSAIAIRDGYWDEALSVLYPNSNSAIPVFEFKATAATPNRTEFIQFSPRLELTHGLILETTNADIAIHWILRN